jgi:aspartyl-tRNA synthetase
MTAQCLLTSAPGAVSLDQLKDLHITPYQAPIDQAPPQ